MDREMRIYSNPRRVRSNSTTLFDKEAWDAAATVRALNARHGVGAARKGAVISYTLGSDGKVWAFIRRSADDWMGTPRRVPDRVVARFLKRTNSNPRRVRSNSTTLRNLASVKITRNRDGTVGIVARRNAPKKRNR